MQKTFLLSNLDNGFAVCERKFNYVFMVYCLSCMIPYQLIDIILVYLNQASLKTKSQCITPIFLVTLQFAICMCDCVPGQMFVLCTWSNNV